MGHLYHGYELNNQRVNGNGNHGSGEDAAMAMADWPTKS